MSQYILKKDCEKNLEDMKNKLTKEYEKKIEIEKKRGLEEQKRYEEQIEIKNKKEIEKISNKYHCYIAGGVRTKEIALEYLNQNAKRVVISTSVINSNLIEEIPINRLIIALDIDNDYNLLLRGRIRKIRNDEKTTIRRN